LGLPPSPDGLPSGYGGASGNRGAIDRALVPGFSSIVTQSASTTVVPSPRILRIVTALLLVWVAFDLAAIDTCALDFQKQAASAQTSVAPLDPQGAAAHSHAVLHPDHCFCHGLSTGADASAALIDPFFTCGGVPGAPPGHLLRTSSALYHPPQLSA
jgi:hypothetical protein